MNNKNIRLRFAPSPTGYLHVGGLRTALFNYLFAKKNNGKLILRIEDTDQKRLVKDSIQDILKTLDWSGIDFDEGPSQGGDLGPYKQSERLLIYQKHMLDLIDSKQAYACFYSDDRINEINKSEIAKKNAAEYDKKFQMISVNEAKERMETENFVIRLKMPKTGEVIIKDEVKGKLKFDYSLIEDPIIIKSDKYPTYHFANVVDDHLMQISHVIRGEEWLPSLPKHVHLYKCFNWDTPIFAHLPLLLNKDRTKLSKRQGDVAVEDYIEKGYLKEALINFIALLGWHESNDKEFYLIDELENAFSLDRVQSSGAVFDIKKLNWLNQKYIQKLSSKDILNQIQPKLPSSWSITLEMIDLVKDKLDNTVSAKQELSIFFETPKISMSILEKQFPSNSQLKSIVNSAIEQFSKIQDIDKNIFNEMMKKIQADTNVGGKDLWQPIRFVITGQVHGPDLSSFISIIGIDECIVRFNNAKL